MMPNLSALGLIARLCKTLEIEGVAYCHWKSNNALDRSASGDNDLDLLVSRAHGQCFAEIMGRLELKEVEASPIQRLPGVLSYYGYDKEADCLVHVHAHYQLILGQDLTKNYRLPIEEPFLASAVQSDLFRVPASEFEFIVFVIRMILKHSTWDAILARQGTLSKKERHELTYLQDKIKQDQVYAILQQHLPWLEARLFDHAVESLQPGCPFWIRLQVGQLLQSKLATQARRSPIADISLKLRRHLMIARLRIFRYSVKKRFAHGGAFIALVGGDGAGKSTAVKELYAWLAQNFDTAKIHIGKPPRSWITFAVDGALKVGCWLDRSINCNWTTQSMVDPNTPALLRHLRLLRLVCTARDRYRLYVKARRFATNGGLVICDRYPLPFLRLMDGPVLSKVQDAGVNHQFVKFLEQMERSYYAQIILPELLIVLRVDPKIAVQRKREEDIARVLERAQEIWTADWRKTPAYVMDAGRAKEELLAELKSLVWSNL